MSKVRQKAPDPEYLAALEPEALLTMMLKIIGESKKNFHSELLLDEVRVISGHRPAGRGDTAKAEYELTVSANWTGANWDGFSARMHGAAQALILDDLTSITLSLIARPGYWMYLGASRTLNSTFLRPAVEGDVLVVKCEVVQVGQQMSTIKGEIRRKRDGALIALCENNKINTEAMAPRPSKM